MRYLASVSVAVVAACLIGAAPGGAAGGGAGAASRPATRPAARGANIPPGPWAPEVLPGKGLAEHPFFYAGEAAPLQVFIVRDGKVAWQYTHPKPEGRQGGGEISDGAYLPDGNVLIAYQYGAAIISPEKKVVWETKAEAGCEIHTAQYLGNNRVMFVQNGDPPKLKVMNTQSGAVEKELTLATANPKSVHLQFRRARVLRAGEVGKETFLVGHMDLNKVVEYDGEGKELWKVEIPSPWSALRLKDGNTLIASNRNFVREVDAKGETVWEFRQADVPDYRIFGTQTAVRLANGNTLINNWRTPAGGNYPVQFIEVTPEKKVVWAVREWGVGGGPNFGASTTVQLLDEGAE